MFCGHLWFCDVGGVCEEVAVRSKLKKHETYCFSYSIDSIQGRTASFGKISLPSQPHVEGCHATWGLVSCEPSLVEIQTERGATNSAMVARYTSGPLMAYSVQAEADYFNLTCMTGYGLIPTSNSSLVV